MNSFIEFNFGDDYKTLINIDDISSVNMIKSKDEYQIVVCHKSSSNSHISDLMSKKDAENLYMNIKSLVNCNQDITNLIND